MIKEVDIFDAAVKTIQAGLTSRGVTPVTVRQWYQRRMVGAPAGMALLLSNVTPKRRHGFLGRQDEWNEADGVMTHTETQAMEQTLQCTGLVKAPPPPTELPPYSAGDLAELAATILASDAGRAKLRELGFGIERITEVRQPYFTDEGDQFEASPSFDFVLVFNQVEQTTTPIVTATEVRVLRV